MSKTKKLQRNPMSLKEHIKQVYYGIKLEISHPAFRKKLIKYLNCKNKEKE